MKQYYMVIDVSLCHDCNNCFLACKDEHVGNQWLPYTEDQPRHGHKWMDILSTERGLFPSIDVSYLPKPCQHCQDAPCIKAYPDCISLREDGIVLIDANKARGVKGLVDSLSLWRHLLERRSQRGAEMHHVRPPARQRGLEAGRAALRA